MHRGRVPNVHPGLLEERVGTLPGFPLRMQDDRVPVIEHQTKFLENPKILNGGWFFHSRDHGCLCLNQWAEMHKIT